eukprot:6580440-Alexandrium_andersonii.AAC.1
MRCHAGAGSRTPQHFACCWTCYKEVGQVVRIWGKPNHRPPAHGRDAQERGQPLPQRPFPSETFGRP